MSNVPEILAPAGSYAALLAALRCGADAVYVGAKQFSARQNAENFDPEALREAIRLCHLYGAKLYLTVNTMLFDREFSALETLVCQAAKDGVDAFLVQDFGVLAYLQKLVPDVPIHASTQMTIHTPCGARWAKEQGLSRVVVSRELSEKEIRAICKEGIEVEQFVHGALCMSVSGQCGLSALIGSRSANRGRCAQACRLPFTAKSHGESYALSLKDLCLVPYVAQMQKSGVASLKIEGRCKRPEYVAAAVTALVEARAGREPDLEQLRNVFSRSGFTDGYYTGKRQEMFGTRQKEDVLRGKQVLPQLEQLYQKPRPCVSLSMTVSLHRDKPVELTLQDRDGHSVHVTGEVPQLARNKATDEAQLTRQLGKLGGTIYMLESLSADCDGESMLPASALNALRREGVAAMDALRIRENTPNYSIQKAPTLPAESTQQKTEAGHFRILLPRWSETAVQLLADPVTQGILLPMDQLPEEIPKPFRDRIFLTLPRFCPAEETLSAQLKTAKEKGISHLVCENVAHLYLGERLGFHLHGGLGLNVANSHCLHFLKSQNLVDTLLSPELTTKQIATCHGLPFGVYAYGNQPVMTMRNCPIQNEIGCKACQHQLTDRTGRQFPVYCHKPSDSVTMYNAVPTWMADKLSGLSACAFFLLDCTLTADPIRILSAYKARKEPDTSITRGLFYRGVE